MPAQPVIRLIAAPLLASAAMLSAWPAHATRWVTYTEADGLPREHGLGHRAGAGRQGLGCDFGRLGADRSPVPFCTLAEDLPRVFQSVGRGHARGDLGRRRRRQVAVVRCERLSNRHGLGAASRNTSQRVVRRSRWQRVDRRSGQLAALAPATRHAGLESTTRTCFGHRSCPERQTLARPLLWSRHGIHRMMRSLHRGERAALSRARRRARGTRRNAARAPRSFLRKRGLVPRRPTRSCRSLPSSSVIGTTRCLSPLPERMVSRELSRSRSRTSREATSARRMPVSARDRTRHRSRGFVQA